MKSEIPLSRLCWLLVVLSWLLAASPVFAGQLPLLKLSVLQFGTAHWELDHLRRMGLDRQSGFELDVRLVANLPASRIAVSSGEVHGAVVDLTWSQARYASGDPYLYLPYSAQMGNVLASTDVRIDSIADLRGKRIGVAGGPDSKGWIFLDGVAKRHGIDLSRDATIQYAAPPLLNQALRRGQVDVLVTFWHFAAELTAARQAYTALDMQELLQELGLEAGLPILGYVFREAWAQAHEDLVANFASALAKAKQQLAEEPRHWQAIRPLMRAMDDDHFLALRQGFVEGIPAELNARQVVGLQRLLEHTGVSADAVMPERLFYRHERWPRSP
ncbi:ABC transporter substrate-binding protein [Halomonas campisalis]|uniref:ABC transporter substrate-binding protein n=1 Tax=Billgrantia campisalis TaxID=74661 RepID=A0ABS9PAA5_9GAMM|nr:ABC transporter substrate-binding protein [Halomonas campisalis]MCG6658192.1 ABC transporter substrate-binding protein [Halomonas campisalis]MDR5862860.1 ABC transporter substrate-binding protein [Halomonas campisalis]